MFEELKHEGNLLFKNKKYQEAIDIYEKAMDFAKTNQQIAIINQNISVSYEHLVILYVLIYYIGNVGHLVFAFLHSYFIKRYLNHFCALIHIFICLSHF